MDNLFQFLKEGYNRVKKTPINEFFLPTANPRKKLSENPLSRKLFSSVGNKLESMPDIKMPEVPEAPETGSPFDFLFQAQEDKLKLGKSITDKALNFGVEEVRSHGKTSNKLATGEKLGITDWLNILDVVPAGKVSDYALKKFFHEGEEKVAKEATEPVVKKILNAIEEAKPIRGEQEKIYSEVRKMRLGKMLGIGKSTSGEKGFFSEIGALKGEFPKVDYESVRKAFKQDEIDRLFDLIKNSKELDPWETVGARSGLAKIMGEAGVQVPQEKELELLTRVFGKDIVDTFMSKRSIWQKARGVVGELVNIPKALRASFDLSAPFRQGWLMVSKPKQFGPAFANMFKYASDERAFKGLIDDIGDRSTYKIMKESGLEITDITRALGNREEYFISQWAEKIPIVGRFVRASDRGYTGFLNKLRADVFDDLVEKGMKVKNLKEVTGSEKWVKELANFVNAGTGRGSLGHFEKYAVDLNSVFFSPRLIASNFQTFEILNPLTYAKKDPFVRKEALKTLFTTSSMALSIIGLASMSEGVEVETSPLNSDFLKIKIGDTRIDLTGGKQQYIRYAAQLITGKYISSATGIEYSVGEGYKPQTRMGILGRFMRSKTSPLASFIVDMLVGTGFTGEEVTPATEIESLTVPLLISDLIDIAKDKDMNKIGLSIPAFFGVGVQNFSASPEEIVKQVTSLNDHVKKLIKSGDVEKANQLLMENQEKVQQQVVLKPKDEQIRALKRTIEQLEKDVRISKGQKAQAISGLEAQIEKLQTEQVNLLDSMKQ